MSDNVNHPEHYIFPGGAEVISITEHLSFNLGNVVKYVARAGRKASASQEEDLQKAQFYLNREIARLTPAETLKQWTLEDLHKLREQWYAGPTMRWVFSGVVGDPVPRQWDHLEDVPDEVIVKDREGDLWYRPPGGDAEFKAKYDEEWQGAYYLDPENFAPFTEVLDG